MSTACRAVVFLGNGKYELRELRVPEPPPGGALLRVEAVGLCGSDAAQFRGVEMVPGGFAFPVVPGHEIVGGVVKLARDAALGVAEGDRVAVNQVFSLSPMRIYGYSDMTGEGMLGGSGVATANTWRSSPEHACSRTIPGRDAVRVGLRHQD